MNPTAILVANLCWAGVLLSGGTALICCIQSRGLDSTPWTRAAVVAVSIACAMFAVETAAIHWSLS